MISQSNPTISPGSTIGMLGGGQLGRMSLLAGRKLGFSFKVWQPGKGCPAGVLAESTINDGFESNKGSDLFASDISIATLEFENIPVKVLKSLQKRIPICPKPEILNICQNRKREKTFLQKNNFPCAKFKVVDSKSSLQKAVFEVGTPSVLKTADFGYDGKGQVKITDDSDLTSIWEEFKSPEGVLEAWVDYQSECSVIVARNSQGQIRTYPVIENRHRNHILDFSFYPANIPSKIQKNADELAIELAIKLDLVGIIAVELFFTSGDQLLVNEIAPRPHNSGHLTIEGSRTSQFEQHIRAVTGLPLGDTYMHGCTVMMNLLGDLWNPTQPNWETLLKPGNSSLHLYGKKYPAPNRKMGHVTFTGSEVETLIHQGILWKNSLY